MRHGRATALLRGLHADIVFLDPPYHLESEYANVLTLLAVKPPVLVIAQHSSRFEPGDGNAALRRTRVLKQGDNSLSFYEPVSSK